MNYSVRCLQNVKSRSCWRNSKHVKTACTKLCTTSMSLCQVVTTQMNTSDYSSTNTERPELVLLKNLLSMDHAKLVNPQHMPVATPKYGPLNDRCRENSNSAQGYLKAMDKDKLLHVWEDTLINQRYIPNGKQLYPSQHFFAKPRMVLSCNSVVESCRMITPKGITKTCEKHGTQCMVEKESQKAQKTETRSSEPSAEQLSLVLLRLREELPHFFEGCHRYSIYSENMLFVNRLTRTTTRSLKTYKLLMDTMQYTARALWYDPSLDILHITKHPEDNTIKVRWSAKGIPWYYLPIHTLTGKPYLFYRYIDGFSIFEVGRDGLVHCHRLDKVIPTATPERQRWSLRMQILALLGLAETERGACEAFQNDNILKKV